MFRIHRSERADALVDALVEELVAEPLDPFTAEVVAVPTRGVERWLTHRIGAAVGTAPGRRDGICAHVDFPFPGRLVGDVLATATGVDPATDPWRPDRLVWPVLSVLDECATEPWLAMVGHHLGAHSGADDVDGADGHDDLRRSRRWSAARHIADLFDRYSVFRPAMVRAWLARSAGADTADAHLPADARWQPQLLRRVRDHVAVLSPPERIELACERLRADDVDLDLPHRVGLFGLTRLPPSHLDVLRALAAVRDVHLYALHPSLPLWDRVAALDVDPAGMPRDEDPTRDVPRHPLLATWAHDSREMQVVLSAAAEADVAHQRAAAGTDDADGPGRLLHRLQRAVRDDIAPPPAGTDPSAALDEDDRSVQVHACHGRTRQVEVLRDAICHLLADDPTLEPRDVIVLCPDIDEFAPLLHATFGCHDDAADVPSGAAGAPADCDPLTGLPRLPYRLADRSLRQTNPLLAALDELLELVGHRLTTAEVLAFAGRPPVRRRFGFDDDALDRIAGWAADSGVRWGLDAEHRAGWQLGTVADHTWRAGLDRLLLGVTMDEDGARLVGDRLPFDDVDGGDVDLAGRLAELVDRLGTVVEGCRGTPTLAAWAEHLARAGDLLFAPPPADAWQRVQLDTILREVLDEAGGGTDHQLDLGEVRALLGRRLEGMPTRADFRTGAVTMCTLVPMRAVPHRVVCLLGLDDGTFPRAAPTDGDDLLLRRPLVGDRDVRTEDRQLLLDAVLAATETLVITYSGHDERTNEPRPPSVPLHELLAVLDRTAWTTDGRPAGRAAVTHHPLQPFDPRAFRSPRPWGFDRTQLAGALAMTADRHPTPPFVAEPLAPRPDDAVVTIEDLIRFVHDPVREFLRQRLGLQVWEHDDSLPEAIPIELDGLQRWAVGDRLLTQLRRGVDIDTAVRAEIGRGTLPPGELRHDILRDAANTALAIDGLATDQGVLGAPASVEVDLEVPDGSDAAEVRLVGTVPGVHGDTIAGVSFSTISPRTRLTLWVRLLAATATDPGVPWATVGVGRVRGRGKLVRHRSIDGSSAERVATATGLLSRLVDLRRRGMCEPLPLPCKTAEAWASAVHRNQQPREAAAREWRGTRWRPGEMAGAHAVRVFGADCSFDTLLTAAPRPTEHGAGWTDEPTRLGRLACRLWDPILAQEAWR